MTVHYPHAVASLFRTWCATRGCLQAGEIVLHRPRNASRPLALPDTRTRILLLFSSNLERFARLYSLRRHTRVNKRHARWSRGELGAEGKIMTVLEASKSTNARADGFAALRAGKTACSSTSPMSRSARTRTSRPCEISFLATPKRRDEPEPSGARRPDLVEGDDQAAIDSHRGRLPLGERPRAPDSGRATLGSSV